LPARSPDFDLGEAHFVLAHLVLRGGTKPHPDDQRKIQKHRHFLIAPVRFVGATFALQPQFRQSRELVITAP
jgi:hypothetical protein